MTNSRTLPQIKKMNWKVLDSRYVYDKKPYMVMREDSVELPNGARIDDFFVFEYPEWVGVLPITPEGNIVLIRQYRHGIGRVCYELVAGVVDPGEPLEESARRELLEETGFSCHTLFPWITASANPSTHTNLCHIFLARNVECLQQQQLDDTEEIAVEVVAPERAKAIMESGEMMQSLHLAALWKYFSTLEK